MTSLPIPDLTAKQRARFLSKIAPANENGCRLWTGWKNQKGYGRFSIRDVEVSATRVAYEMFVGPIPDGMQLDHRCRNPPCVNTDHLRPVTNKQNQEHLAGANVDNSTGVRGVSKRTLPSGRVRWQTEVGHHGRSHRFGSYDTIEEADAAVTAGRRSLFTHDDAGDW